MPLASLTSVANSPVSRRRISSLGSSTLHGLVEVLRLVVAQPENFRGGEAGQRRVGDHADQLACGRRPGCSISSHSAAVRWSFHNRARRIDAVLLVEKHRAVHLARQADRLHVGRLELGLLHDGPDRLHRGLPPILRVLLAPQRLGMVARVGGQSPGPRILPRSLMASVLVPDVPMSMPR